MNIYLKNINIKLNKEIYVLPYFVPTNIHYFLFKFKHDNIYEKLFHQYLN